MCPPLERPDPSHSFPISLFLREGLVRVSSSNIRFLVGQLPVLHKNIQRSEKSESELVSIEDVLCLLAGADDDLLEI